VLRRNLKGAYTIWYRDVIRFGRDRPRIIAALVVMALLSVAFIIPAVWQFGRQD
jgi:hypothetical protein